MSYFDLNHLQALIPSAFLLQALDDDGDDVIDAFEAVKTQAEGEVDAYLAPSFATPIPAPVPQIVSKAAVTLAAELCYRRRGTPDEANPWVSAGRAMRKLLQDIGQGKIQMQVSPNVAPALPEGSLESWDSALGQPGRTLG